MAVTQGTALVWIVIRNVKTYLSWIWNEPIDQNLNCQLKWHKTTFSLNLLDLVTFFGSLYWSKKYLSFDAKSSCLWKTYLWHFGSHQVTSWNVGEAKFFDKFWALGSLTGSGSTCNWKWNVLDNYNRLLHYLPRTKMIFGFPSNCLRFLSLCILNFWI